MNMKNMTVCDITIRVKLDSLVSAHQASNTSLPDTNHVLKVDTKPKRNYILKYATD